MPRNTFFRKPEKFFTQIGLALAVSFFLNQLVLAEDPLTKLEEGLFSSSYAGESSTQRLSRLETSVFGEAQTGSESSRITRLEQALNRVLQSKQESRANTSTQNDSSTAADSTAEPTPTYTPAREPDATDYPTVTALERQVFGRDFLRDDVSQRLDRLEKKVYGQASPQTAMADRVDKLLARYPNLNQPAAAAGPQTVDISPALQNLPDDPSQFSGGSRDVYAKLDALERHQFNGKNSPNALLTERLDRLEKKVFNRTFSGESVDTRINRMMSQYQSTNGSPVANSRPDFQQRQAYQSPAYSSYPGAPVGSGNAPRQNIQFGSGFSSNSTHSFSPEMMSMLPPNVRGQMSNGTVTSAPGTVVVERQSYGTPGFQTYNNGAPIQHYNYYSAPGTQTQSQSTTTVIQPDGSQAIYGYPGATPNYNNPNGLPNPAYVGDPALLQSLNKLETQVFGQVNTVEPVPIRLGKLETKLMGQMFVGLPDQQRLINLEKAHQMQAIDKLLKNNQGMGKGSGRFSIGVPLGPNPLNPMGMQNMMPINPGVYGW